jgi:transposase-like protein
MAGAVCGDMGDSSLKPLVLSEDERRTLEHWVKRRSTAQGLALRARIVLACAQGGSNLAVAARLGISRNTVGKWREHFRRIEHNPRSSSNQKIQASRRVTPVSHPLCKQAHHNPDNPAAQDHTAR